MNDHGFMYNANAFLRIKSRKGQVFYFAAGKFERYLTKTRFAAEYVDRLTSENKERAVFYMLYKLTRTDKTLYDKYLFGIDVIAGACILRSIRKG